MKWTKKLAQALCRHHVPIEYFRSITVRGRKDEVIVKYECLKCGKRLN